MGFTKESSEEAAVRKEQQSGGMRKWSRFSLGCNACNNYLRKHGDGRAHFILDPTATASLLACAAATGLEYNFTALTQTSLALSFPGTLRNLYLIQRATWGFFSSPWC